MTDPLIPVADEAESRLHLRDIAALASFGRWADADPDGDLCLAAPPDMLRQYADTITGCLLPAGTEHTAHHAFRIERGPVAGYVEVQWPHAAYPMPSPDPDPDGYTGLERMRKTLADAAGWQWCAEHRRARYDGVSSCVAEHPPAPRGHVCAVHGCEHPEGWFDECRSEVEVVEAAAGDEHVVVELGLWDRITAKLHCMRRRYHRWRDDGDTLGGIWLRCIDCGTVDEFLPGLHEPRGGEEVWQYRLAEARRSR